MRAKVSARASHVVNSECLPYPILEVPCPAPVWIDSRGLVLEHHRDACTNFPLDDEVGQQGLPGVLILQKEHFSPCCASIDFEMHGVSGEMLHFVPWCVPLI